MSRITGLVVFSIFGYLFMLATPGRAEVIGPWVIQATPASAALVSGGHFTGTDCGWLNVVNSPITLDQALTGFSVIDDGCADFLPGSIVDLAFAPGTAANNSGPDLVLFDGRFDSFDNSYAVSTNFDGFASELPLPSGVFTDTGEDRSYFYFGVGPFATDVWAAPIDLTLLGVPEGVSVSTVRVRTISTGADLLGLGALAPQRVPEPGALTLLGTGLASIVARRRVTGRPSRFDLRA